MAAEFTGFEPSRLCYLGYFEGKSVFEASPELGIVEKSIEESLERNHVRNNYQGHRRFSETPASMQMEDILNKSVLFLLLYICLLNKFS